MSASQAHPARHPGWRSRAHVLQVLSPCPQRGKSLWRLLSEQRLQHGLLRPAVHPSQIRTLPPAGPLPPPGAPTRAPRAGRGCPAGGAGPGADGRVGRTPEEAGVGAAAGFLPPSLPPVRPRPPPPKQTTAAPAAMATEPHPPRLPWRRRSAPLAAADAAACVAPRAPAG